MMTTPRTTMMLTTTEGTNNMTTATMTVEPLLFNGTGGDANGSGQVFENPMNQPSVRVTFILLYSIVFAMCFLGNIMVLVVFAYSKRMRTRTNLFLANLAVADFCVGVFCVLPNLSIHLSPFWTLGRVMCKLYFFVNCLAYTASILLLVVIAVERYIAIMHPLRSRGYFTAPRLLVAQVVVWVAAAAYNVPILLIFDTMDTSSGSFCFLTVSLLNLKAYYSVHFLLWYLFPLSLILLMYGRISCTLWATSITAVPVSRSDSRGSVSTTMAMDTQINPHHLIHNHHQHHNHHHGSSCGATMMPGRSSVTYCDVVGENGVGSVLTVGASGGGGGAGVTEGGRSGADPEESCRKNEGMRVGRGMHGSKSRLMDAVTPGEEGGGGWARMMVRNSSRGGDLDKAAQRLLTRSPSRGKAYEQMEMAALNGLGGCFSCVQGKAAVGRGFISYLHCSETPHAHFLPAAPRTRQASSKKHLQVDDYAYELSDIPSSDDYDSYQSHGGGEGAGSRSGGGGGVGGGGVADVKYNGYGAGGNSGVGIAQRKPRTQCRISSQRGLTSRRRVIRLLVAVVTIFAICVLPYNLRNLLHYWNVHSARSLLDYLSPISSVMMYLNCGLNPFIYWMFSDHFRRSLRETVCFWRRGGHRSISRVMLSSPRQNKTFSLKPYDAM